MSELVGKVSESVYLGRSLRVFDGIYKPKTADQEFSMLVQFAVHPNLSRRIIINVPGYNGVIDGFADKYKILGNYMQSEGLGAVVRTGNEMRDGNPVDINLRAVLCFAEGNAQEICGDPKPEVLLMGFSAGASAIAARAHEYPQVSTVILFAPSGNMPRDEIVDGLAKFKGDLYVVVGEDDDVVGAESGQIFYDLATGASHRELFLIPDCDHQFRGEKNGRIISEAPFYAFAKGEKPSFPDSHGGIKLYD